MRKAKMGPHKGAMKVRDSKDLLSPLSTHAHTDVLLPLRSRLRDQARGFVLTNTPRHRQETFTGAHCDLLAEKVEDIEAAELVSASFRPTLNPASLPTCIGAAAGRRRLLLFFKFSLFHYLSRHQVKTLQAATGAHKPNGYEFNVGEITDADYYKVRDSDSCPTAHMYGPSLPQTRSHTMALGFVLTNTPPPGKDLS